MITLRRYLDKVGLISGVDLLKIYNKAEDEIELEKMIVNSEVSVHVEALGLKWYRYPFYEPKVKGPNKIIELVTLRPWLNAKTIRETLKISQTSFERQEAELMQNGSLTRTKRGTAWLYSAGAVEPVEVVEPVGSIDRKVLGDAWLDLFMNPGESVQSRAKENNMSRDSMSKVITWMTDNGMLKDDQLIWPDDVDEREVWLKKNFPQFGDDLDWITGRVKPPTLPSYHTPTAGYQEHDGRFKNKVQTLELGEDEQEVIDYLDEEVEVEVMLEELEIPREGHKLFKRMVSKLYSCGYIGKVVKGDYTAYCSVERV